MSDRETSKCNPDDNCLAVKHGLLVYFGTWYQNSDDKLQSLLELCIVITGSRQVVTTVNAAPALGGETTQVSWPTCETFTAVSEDGGKTSGFDRAE